MCTLILGVDVLGPRTVFLAANRDEDPARPSNPPRVLGVEPRRVGGSDRRAGGTWLAVRAGEAAVALLNRRGSGPPQAPRSRGLLALDVAGAERSSGASLAAACEARLRAETGRHAFAAFSMVFASPDESWIAAHDPAGALEVAAIAPGWHVATHEAMDAAGEPRTAWLLERLAGWRPAALEDAVAGLTSRLATHPDAGGAPAVCVHDGRMSTVSSSLVWLAPGVARYLHAEGRPCVAPWSNVSKRLGPQIGDPS